LIPIQPIMDDNSINADLERSDKTPEDARDTSEVTGKSLLDLKTLMQITLDGEVNNKGMTKNPFLPSLVIPDVFL